jgi:Poxvirus A32 protein
MPRAKYLDGVPQIPKKAPKPKSKVKVTDDEIIPSNKITNFYDLLPKNFVKKYHNPAYKKHLINIPFRMLIVGGSGVGKTSALMEIIHRMKNTFNFIAICCKSKEEPLYQYLEEKIGDSIEFYEGIDNIPDLSEFEDRGQSLIVFDDLVLEKDQKRIEQYFIRARKVGGGVSCCYLTQSYFRTPKMIRAQCNYIILKKLGEKRDLNLILSEFSLGVDKTDLASKYAAAMRVPNSFLLIDVSPDTQDVKRFREGFLKFL